jgi:hypothetical protein
MGPHADACVTTHQAHSIQFSGSGPHDDAILGSYACRHAIIACVSCSRASYFSRPPSWDFNIEIDGGRSAVNIFHFGNISAVEGASGGGWLNSLMSGGACVPPPNAPCHPSGTHCIYSSLRALHRLAPDSTAPIRVIPFWSSGTHYIHSNLRVLHRLARDGTVPIRAM